MTKFQVGDKVRCIKPWRNDNVPECNLLQGMHYTVMVISPLSGNLGLVGQQDVWWSPDRFELVKEDSPKPHKHAELIKAWADGAQIQELFDGTWRNTFYPRWHDTTGYFRIKPKQDEVRYAFATVDNYAYTYWHNQQRDDHNVKATFDGETGKLKAVEILA